MSITDAQASFILGRTYNFNDNEDAFYEPYGETPPYKTMRQAHISDGTHVLVRYDPTLLVPPE